MSRNSGASGISRSGKSVDKTLSRRRRVAFAEDSESKFVNAFAQERRNYLEVIEPDINFSDVLSSDKFAGSSFRSFLKNEPTNESYCSFFATGILVSNIGHRIAYDIWQELEQLRTTYFELSANDLKKQV